MLTQHSSCIFLTTSLNLWILFLEYAKITEDKTFLLIFLIIIVKLKFNKFTFIYVNKSNITKLFLTTKATIKKYSQNIKNLM